MHFKEKQQQKNLSLMYAMYTGALKNHTFLHSH